MHFLSLRHAHPLTQKSRTLLNLLYAVFAAMPHISPKGLFTYDVRTDGEGIGSKADNNTDRLREWNNDKGEGYKNPHFSALFIFGWPLGAKSTPPLH